MSSTKKRVEGNEATWHVAYAMSEVAAIYPNGRGAVLIPDPDLSRERGDPLSEGRDRHAGAVRNIQTHGRIERLLFRFHQK